MPGANGHTPKAYLSGLWRDWNAVQGNLGGTWRLASDVYVKHGDIWKQVWVRLTAPTNGSRSISDTTVTISWTAGVGQEGFKLYRDGVFVKDVVSTVTNAAVSTTDPVPALNTTYTYTVSAYAGATETAQISCGDAVGYSVPATTTSVTINTDWGYTNSTWNNNQIVFNTSSSAVTNATDYQYSFNSGASAAGTTTAPTRSTTFNLDQDGEVNVAWRARRAYNSVTYNGPWSTTAVNVKAGRPLIRNAATNFNYNKEVYRGQTVGETVDFGAFGTVVDSYVFRSVDAVGSSLLANDTRRVIFRRPSGAGGNISIPFGASNVSGTSDDSGTYQQGPFTNYVAGTYAVSAISASGDVGGWSASSTPYISYQLRFVVRSISQVDVAYEIT
jgi:hypothetical protein